MNNAAITDNYMITYSPKVISIFHNLSSEKEALIYLLSFAPIAILVTLIVGSYIFYKSLKWKKDIIIRDHNAIYSKKYRSFFDTHPNNE